MLLSCAESKDKKQSNFLYNISGVWRCNLAGVKVKIDCRSQNMSYTFGRVKRMLTIKSFDIENHTMGFTSFDSLTPDNRYSLYIRQAFDKEEKTFTLVVDDETISEPYSLSYIHDLDN
jgi:hypothetical protein